MKAIADLSGKALREVEKSVGKLEQACGFPSEDVRALVESNQLLRTKLSQLGLDPDDTTGEELHYTLISKYQKDCAAVDSAIGITRTTSPGNKISKAIELAEHSFRASGVWALKNTSARALLRSNSPNKLMKNLGYRSVDSLLKREDVQSVFAACVAIESETWHKKTNSLASKLGTTSYEIRQPKVVTLSSRLKIDNIVIENQMVAAIGLSSKKAESLPALYLALKIVDALTGFGEQYKTTDLSAAHIALHWWKDTEHLLMPTDAGPVSLNLKDVAENHANNLNFNNASRQHAHQAFWNNLMSRYKEYVDDLPLEIEATKQRIYQPKNFAALAFEPVEA